MFSDRESARLLTRAESPAGKCLYDLVRASAEHRPDAIAIQGQGQRPITYLGLQRQMDGVVTAMRSYGVGPVDRIAMVLPPGAQAAVATVAVASGAICAPLNSDLRTREFESYLVNLEPKALLVPEGCRSAAVPAALKAGFGDPGACSG